jgi:hypothetical protein
MMTGSTFRLDYTCIGADKPRPSTWDEDTASVWPTREGIIIQEVEFCLNEEAGLPYATSMALSITQADVDNSKCMLDQL